LAPETVSSSVAHRLVGCNSGNIGKILSLVQSAGQVAEDKHTREFNNRGITERVYSLEK
jgi:hypothetical protein